MKMNILVGCFLGCLMAFPATGSAGIDPEMRDKIVAAIYHAEGGVKAKRPYGVLSVPCDSRSECKRVCQNTVANNYKRWMQTDRAKPFLVFLRDRYAPLSHHKLNANWLRNVEAHLYGGVS